MAQLLDVSRGNKTNETITFVMEECCNCGIPFMMPSYHQKRLINSQEQFYCPNGHPQHYCGKTDAQKIQEKLDEEKRNRAAEKERLEKQWLEQYNAKTKLEKQLKRIHKGVCPCCNRSFQNLKRHMETKHPEIKS